MTSVLLAAAAMGLFGGWHCATMCGGVASVMCAASARTARGGSPAIVAYNLGRWAGYVLLGAIVGTLGSLLEIAPSLDVVRFVLRTIAVLAMLAVGLMLAGLPSMVGWFEAAGAPLWRAVSPLTRRFLPVRTVWQGLALGLLWGLMPCGLLYTALALAASTESTLRGAATMAVFGLATLPVMLTLGALADATRSALRRGWVRRTAGVAMLAFGAWSATALAAEVAPEGTPLVGHLAPHCHFPR